MELGRERTQVCLIRKPYPQLTVGLGSGTRGLCLPEVQALRGSQHHRAFQDDPTQREEKEGLGGGRCLSLRQSLPPRRAWPGPGTQSSSQASRREREQTILNVCRRQRRQRTELPPELRGRRHADLLLTIDPLGPGAPGGPIMPRSPCDGDNNSGGHSCGWLCGGQVKRDCQRPNRC